MKKLVTFIILLIILVSCQNQSAKKSVLTENDPEQENEKVDKIENLENENRPYITYSEFELRLFLDSIGQLNPDLLAKGMTKKVDSVLNNQTTLNHELSTADFEKLKTASKEQLIDIDFAKKIFPNFQFDNDLTEYTEENTIPIEFYSFDKNEDDFKEFASSIRTNFGEGDIYFFNSKKIIAKHAVYYRYHLYLKHFKNENNQTVIYYKVFYNSGSGICWVQFNFYKYRNNKITPLLTEIHDITYQWMYPRMMSIESTIVSERPLQLKFVYENQFCDPKSDEEIVFDCPRVEFINDQTVVTYHIDPQSGKYIPNFKGTKLNRNKMLSYFLIDESHFIFVNTHYDLFKEGLNGEDYALRNAILNFLNYLKNYGGTE